MATIKIPAAGKDIRSGTVIRWLKKPGDPIKKGEILAELDTESGVLHVESPIAGNLKTILLDTGKTGPVSAPLAEIADELSSAPPLPLSPAPASPPPPRSPAAAAGKVTPILMPKAGQSMEEGVLVKWHVAPGDVIKVGQAIFEIETDKATMDVEAIDSGRLARIIAPAGKTVPVQQPVAFIAESDADVDAFLASGGSPAATAATASAPGSASSATSPSATIASARATTAEGRVKASPAARKIAADRGIDIATVAAGTGPGGRILSTDLPLTAPAPAASGSSRRRMSQMRKAIARNLLQSKQTIPHFYVRLTVDAAPMVAFYQAAKAKYPCSINDVIVLASSRLVQEFPAFRSRLEGDEFVESPTANIGIAVGMDDGLVVPVLVGANRLSLQQIAAETKRLAASAKAGKIEGMGLGTFTITNLGMFGTEEFAAIINPPEAAILAVGAARESVIVKDGAMRAGKVMTMTLSSDHRIIDGMLAAKFLARMKELLESPDKLAP